jgi:hypothetical protein
VTRRDGSVAIGAATGGLATGVPPHVRPRPGNDPIVGTAVPRGSVPAAPGGGTSIVLGGTPLYPWWFGLGGAGYYGYYGASYLGGYYDPWFGGYSGGYAGNDGWYDNPQPQVSGGAGSTDEGSLRLKIKPREAQVFVDGYYVGIVDDFNGVFQKLHVETGTHRVEVRAEGYEPLTFEVRITPKHATTYQGELKRIQ